MSDVAAFPPLGCRGRLIDPGLIGNVKPFRIVYAFLGEPVLFWKNMSIIVFKIHSVIDGLYVVSVLPKWVGASERAYDDLRQSECYLALVDDTGENPTWNVEKLWRVDFDTIPRHFLPLPGMMPLESS